MCKGRVPEYIEGFCNLQSENLESIDMLKKHV